ncbi:MAG TPA: LemA family protein [Bryobacteraceae bacterium]|nr:LemA family protein [Bryobacteraceae bacterium]
MKYLILAAVAAALVLGARGAAIREDLVAERQAIDADWTQVNAALEHRGGIIPDLTQTVQAQVPSDAAVNAAILAVNDARQALGQAPGQHEKIQANARLDDALAHLMLAIEMYPKLDGGKKYSDLLESLRGAEYQIAVARRKYNEAVEHYNARIAMFPDNIVSSVARLGKIDAYFETPLP